MRNFSQRNSNQVEQQLVKYRVSQLTVAVKNSQSWDYSQICKFADQTHEKRVKITNKYDRKNVYVKVAKSFKLIGGAPKSKH